jgi:glycosyltransferase involved in cell wall biosynthesis
VKIGVDFWSTGYNGDAVQLPLVAAIKDSGKIDQRLIYAEESASAQLFDAFGVPSVVTPSRMQGASPVALLSRIRNARANLKTFYEARQPLVHVTMHSLCDQPFIDIPKKCGAKILLTVHNGQYHIGEESWVMTLSERRLISLADEIAVLSHHARDMLVERIGDKKTIHVVSPGLVMNNEPPGPPKKRKRDRPLRFLFFGRIVDYKGLDTLLDAWHLLDKMNNSPISLTIAGSGELTKYNQKIEVFKNIEVKNGWLSNEEMERVFLDCDVNVLAYREGSTSATSLAGMWAGMPSIATPIGAFREQLFEGVNALITRDLTANALADQMQRLIQSPDLFDRLAKGAHEQAKLLGGPHVAKNWETVYERVLSGTH